MLTPTNREIRLDHLVDAVATAALLLIWLGFVYLVLGAIGEMI